MIKKYSFLYTALVVAVTTYSMDKVAALKAAQAAITQFTPQALKDAAANVPGEFPVIKGNLNKLSILAAQGESAESKELVNNTTRLIEMRINEATQNTARAQGPTFKAPASAQEDIASLLAAQAALTQSSPQSLKEAAAKISSTFPIIKKNLTELAALAEKGQLATAQNIITNTQNLVQQRLKERGATNISIEKPTPPIPTREQVTLPAAPPRTDTSQTANPPTPSQTPIAFSAQDKQMIDKHPRLFENIPDNLKPKLAQALRDSGEIWVTEALEDSSSLPQKEINRAQWTALGRAFGVTPLHHKMFQPFSNKYAPTVEQPSLSNYFPSDDPNKLIAKELVQRYKIHLMPVDSVNKTALLLLILEEYKKNELLQKSAPMFKIALEKNELHRGQVLPVVVFYTYSKENAQKTLDILYNLFKNHPEIKGSGIRPRFNAKVNDLIWVAQGDGDYKTGRYEQYFEPSRIYYKPDFAGTVENYHLKHPETGRELTD